MVSAHPYEVIPVNKPTEKRQLTDEGTFDFIDSPLSDKPLVPSGTSQNSRINVKKGPNGQDYEYEYVYYYYDEEEEGGKPGKQSNSHDGPAVQSPTTARAQTTARPTTTEAISNTVRGRGRPPAPVVEEEVPAVRGNGKNR